MIRHQGNKQNTLYAKNSQKSSTQVILKANYPTHNLIILSGQCQARSPQSVPLIGAQHRNVALLCYVIFRILSTPALVSPP